MFNCCCLFESAKLRRHLHLGAVMQQVINGEYLYTKIVLVLSVRVVVACADGFGCHIFTLDCHLFN